MPVPEPDPVATPADAEGQGQPEVSGELGPTRLAAPSERSEPDRVFFLVADASEGPTANVDPEVVTRRAKRAMERLLEAG